MTNPNDNSVALLDAWSKWQRGSREARPSEATIIERRRVLGLLAERCDPVTATAEEVVRFLVECEVKSHTRATYRSYLHSWFRWLVRQGLRVDNPMDLASTRRRSNMADPRRKLPAFPVAWKTPIADWLTHCQAAAHTATTIRHRSYQLARVAKVNPHPWEATRDDLADYMSNPNWGAEARSSQRQTLRSFYGWAFDAGRIPVDPSVSLPKVRVPMGQPRPAPAQVILDALQHADPRAALMLLLGAHAGLRRAEIAKVHTRDLVDGLLRVTGKGGRTRRIPLGVELATVIAARPEGYLFPGQIDGHLSDTSVGDILSKLLGPGWTAHTLRHAFASKAYAVERDILAVQQLLGHSTPTTTARYAAVPDDALRRAVEAAAGTISPRGTLRIVEDSA